MSETETGAALLALSPDEVFASRSIAEVVELHKRIQDEIERKREDLRAMVGERYRDLIHAADTIEDMKGSAGRAAELIDGTVALCRNLHDTHLIGFRIPDKTNYTDRNNPTAVEHSVAVQVKLLLDIPEQIWTCVESEDYLTATQLYILARHINTGLQLQASSKSQQAVSRRVRGLVERQWASVSDLQQILEQAARDKLQEIDLTEEMACSCLLTLYLLDAKSSLVELLNEFIVLHSNRSLESTLELDVARPETGNLKDEIRSRIVSSVKVVLRTIELVQKCFVEREGGTMSLRLTELYRKDSSPLLDLVIFPDVAALKLLPPVITSYRLTASGPIRPLSGADVSSCVSAWAASVRGYIRERVGRLLRNITSAKTLHHIREEALKIETPDDWQDICESLSMPHTDVWSQYFQPLLTARVKEIIDAKWQAALDALKSQMASDLASVSREECEEKEADLNWFVWRDLIGDTVIESRERVVDVMNDLMKGMWLQDRGFTPTLERLCAAADSELSRLLRELEPYVRAREPEAGRAAGRDVTPYLRDVAGRNVDSILQYIKEECLENSNFQTTELQRKTTAVYTARFVQALPYLVPSLRACYAPPHPDYLEPYDGKEDEGEGGWSEVCARLKETCLYCWGRWVDIAVQKVRALTAGLPQEFTIEANLDYLLMQWDVIKIEEKDDDGNTVESTIKIPAGPSLKLQEYLYAVGRILDEVVPHTLPREVHLDFIERVADVTLSHYDRVVREKETEINQKCALQLLMDVRHFTLLLIPRESKRASDVSHETCEVLRKIIDPFDYDVFYPYIQANVKRSVQRVTTMLGGAAAGGGGAAGAGAGGAAAERAPTLLATPSAAPWFSLLPVAAPAAALKKPDKMRKKAGGAGAAGGAAAARGRDPSGLVASSLPINLATAKSGAAAFFGSMTSDWFSS